MKRDKSEQTYVTSFKFTQKNFLVLIFGLVLLSFLIPGTKSYAAPSVVTSRAALGGNDFVNWNGFGASPTVIPNPSNIGSNTGIINITVSIPSGQFRRLDQGNGWNGNFASGDHLLYTNDNPGPMVILFDTPVNGAGAQIQAETFGSFTATINVYDASNTLIGSFNLAGNSTNAGNNSAIFLGVKDNSPTIKRIEYTVNTTVGDLAINQLDLIDPQAPESVPTMTEWGIIIFIVFAGLGAVYSLRRRRIAES
jgi:hypothetical protein